MSSKYRRTSRRRSGRARRWRRAPPRPPPRTPGRRAGSRARRTRGGRPPRSPRAREGPGPLGTRTSCFSPSAPPGRPRSGSLARSVLAAAARAHAALRCLPRPTPPPPVRRRVLAACARLTRPARLARSQAGRGLRPAAPGRPLLEASPGLCGAARLPGRAWPPAPCLPGQLALERAGQLVPLARRTGPPTSPSRAIRRPGSWPGRKRQGPAGRDRPSRSGRARAASGSAPATRRRRLLGARLRQRPAPVSRPPARPAGGASPPPRPAAAAAPRSRDRSWTAAAARARPRPERLAPPRLASRGVRPPPAPRARRPVPQAAREPPPSPGSGARRRGPRRRGRTPPPGWRPPGPRRAPRDATAASCSQDLRLVRAAGPCPAASRRSASAIKAIRSRPRPGPPPAAADPARRAPRAEPVRRAPPRPPPAGRRLPASRSAAAERQGHTASPTAMAPKAASKPSPRGRRQGATAASGVSGARRSASSTAAAGQGRRGPARAGKSRDEDPIAMLRRAPRTPRGPPDGRPPASEIGRRHTDQRAPSRGPRAQAASQGIASAARPPLGSGSAQVHREQGDQRPRNAPLQGGLGANAPSYPAEQHQEPVTIGHHG